MNRVNQTEAYLNTLPNTHQDMLLEYRNHLNKIRHCIDQNYQIIRKISENFENLFENENQTVVSSDNEHMAKLRTMDLDKVSPNAPKF